MSLDIQPASDSGHALEDPWTDFRVHDEREILRILRQLRDGSVPVQLSAPDGSSLTLALWSYDTEFGRVAFSADPQNPNLARFIEADEAAAMAYLESVKLQFDLRGLVLVRGATTCALQATMPREMYRFQRRAAFRVRMAERLAPTACLRHPAIAEMQLTLRVLDVSIGGCALLLPSDVPPFEPGAQLAGVRIELDADTCFTATLTLHHVSSGGTFASTRLGCEWQQIDSTSQRALQRYIDLMQRRRRLLVL
jgi:c-di-GMP-binding flagellar brake protein YcgR